MKLTPAERDMLAAKYKSKQIKFMSESELSKWTKALLLKISVITGWIVPADDALYTVTIDQFKNHLQEQYFELNPDEIEYAFRAKGTMVEDWGKNLSLNLIDKILKPYLFQRYQVSSQEEKINFKDDGYCTESSLNWYREQIELAYQNHLAGKYVKPYWYWFNVLVNDGFIKGEIDCHPDDKCRSVVDLFKQAKAASIQNLYIKNDKL